MPGLIGQIETTAQRKPSPKRNIVRPRVVKPTGVFKPPGSTQAFAPAQHHARARVQHAQTRLPETPTPTVPVLSHYTPAQKQTAQVLYTRSRQKALGRRPSQRPGLLAQLAAGGVSPVAALEQQLLHQDPRSMARLQGVLKAINPAQYRGLNLYNPDAGTFRGTSARNTHKIGIPVLGSVSVNPHAIGSALSSLTSLGAASAENDFVKAALGDVKTIATAPFVGGYELGRAGVEGLASNPELALGGPLGFGAAIASTKRGQRFAKGTADATLQTFEHPVKSLREHPLLTALTFAGTESVVGRGLGAGARGLKLDAGSTVRPPLALTEEPAGPVVQRTYSKDLFRKGAQAARDAQRKPLLDASGNPVTRMDRGHRVPVLKATEAERARHFNRLGDHTAARANDVERMVRGEANRNTRPARVSRGGRQRVTGRKARDLVAMVTEGTITTGEHFRRDLEAHGRRLVEEYRQRSGADPGFIHSGEAEVAARRITQIRDALNDPKVMRQAQAIASEGIRLGGELNAQERKLLAVRAISSESRATGARLSVAKIEHLGGRHFTEEAHARLEAQARTAEAAARTAYEKAPAGERAARKAEWRAARDERIAVSGRDPVGVNAHERATSKEATARKKQQDAQVRIARLKHRRSRMVGRHEVHRGQQGAVRAYYVGEHRFETRAEADTYARGNGGRVEVVARTAAEARRTGELANVDRQIARAERQARDAGQAARVARHDLRRNPMPRQQAGLRTAEGKFLPHSAVEDFLRSRGRNPDTVAYLPHRDDVRGARAHHAQMRPGTRPTMDKPGTRTGEAYRKGATEASTELLHDHGVRQAVILAKTEQLDKMVTENGLRHPAWAKAGRGETLTAHEQRVVDHGGYFNGKESGELATRIEEDTSNRPVLVMKNGHRYVAVRAFPAKLDEASQAIIRDGLQGPGAMESLPQRLLNDRFLTREELGKDTTRNVVLMPAELVERLEQHLRPAGELEKMLQLTNRPFRMAVLPQPRWLTGNFVEPYLVRLPTVGSGAVNVPGLALDIKASVSMLRRMDKSVDPAVRQAAQEMRAQHTGGLLIGARGASNRRAVDEFALYRRIVGKLPVMHTMADLTAKLGRVLLAPAQGFFTANRVLIEQWAQHASIGRSIRQDIQEFTGSWLATVKLGQQALDEVGRGLVDTPTQHRFLKEQHVLLGKYSGYSPRIRALVQGPMPFLPWSLNAARFVLWTMPAHRSALTALLVDTQQMVADEWKADHADTPPWAKGLDFALRTKRGGYVDLARYTPWGLTIPVSEGDLQGVTQQALPQVSGVEAAARGLDPFGNPLKFSDGTRGHTSAGAIVNAALGSLVPYVSMIQRIREGGGTAYADSNVISPKTKPGSKHMSGLRRALDPFRPTYLNAPTVAAKKAAPQTSTAPESPADRLLRQAAERGSLGGLTQAQQDLLYRAALAGG